MAGNLSGMDIIELSRMVENLIRIGTIHSVDHAAVRVRVQLGKLTTEWLRWFEHRAGQTTTWDPPTVGEQCMVFSPSGELANGIVLVGIDSGSIQPPSHNENKHVTRFADDAVISYDHAEHHLEISGITTCCVIASESITFDTPLTHCTGKLTVDQLLTYGNGINGTGGDNLNVITGQFTHNGGNLSSNGIVLHTHLHEGVISGGDITGVPI